MECVYELRDVSGGDFWHQVRLFRSVDEAIEWVKSFPDDEELAVWGWDEDADEKFELVELPIDSDLTVALKRLVTFERLVRYHEDVDRYYRDLVVTVLGKKI